MPGPLASFPSYRPSPTASSGLEEVATNSQALCWHLCTPNASLLLNRSAPLHPTGREDSEGEVGTSELQRLLLQCPKPVRVADRDFRMSREGGLNKTSELLLHETNRCLSRKQLGPMPDSTLPPQAAHVSINSPLLDIIAPFGPHPKFR